MKQFTGAQKAQHAEILARMEQKRAALELAIADYNHIMGREFSPVEAAKVALQEVIDEGSAFLATVREDAQSFFDDKSEKWQESEAGEAYGDWLTELDRELEAVEVEEPDEVDTPDVDAIDTFEGIRQGVEE